MDDCNGQCIVKMLKPLTRPYFLIAILLYLIVHLGRFGWYEPIKIVNSYLTDLLCMPIILTFCLAGIRLLKRIPTYVLTLPMIVAMTTFYAILFEYYLPNANSKYTADFVDVIMYFAGAGLYWIIWNWVDDNERKAESR